MVIWNTVKRMETFINAINFMGLESLLSYSKEATGEI
jgi:hypothetical protein